MKLAVLKETRAGESRVAAVPDTVKKLVGLRYDVTVEKDAGLVSAFSNEDYEDAGAKIAATAEEAAKNADIILKVQRPDANELKFFANGAKLVGILSPYADEESLSEYARAGIDAFAMEFMPRITRAQSMDVLSSQSNLAGYKAVIDAAAEYGRAMPMMMTAAGTIAPAKVFVMGAGVAGLQAIATAKRLGAVVSATDVRYAAKEQVESLGGTFVVVDEEAMKDAETEGGYAKEMSDDFKKRQAEFVAAHIAKQDIVITTALIPGRPAPELVSDGMVRAMKPGSVIVDLAVEQGGNVAPSKAGEIVHVDGVKVVGHNNVPGRLAADASSLYAKNILNFLTAFTDAETGTLNIDMEDEIINGILLTRDGQIIHPAFAREPEPQAVVAEVVEADEDVKE
ncbi:MAG: Re/Si-specific NAD(P)(+) transhydrogenase subunit alpha [Aquisalinus sp.]|nr:Re/Si-specific NAD(P)(+) transhydrogenase subunit alpha [Aquisalinus sp.]